MNYELKRQLKTLSVMPGDPGAAAFRALLRRRAGLFADRIERQWRSMILMMPELLERVRQDGARAEVPPGAKKLYGFLLSYLYSTTDLIPEDGNGFFGYVDDAYLVAAAHQRLAGMEAEPGTKDWLEAFRRVAPSEAAQLDAMLDELLAGRTASYEAALGATA